MTALRSFLAVQASLRRRGLSVAFSMRQLRTVWQTSPETRTAGVAPITRWPGTPPRCRGRASAPPRTGRRAWYRCTRVPTAPTADPCGGASDVSRRRPMVRAQRGGTRAAARALCLDSAGTTSGARTGASAGLTSTSSFRVTSAARWRWRPSRLQLVAQHRRGPGRPGLSPCGVGRPSGQLAGGLWGPSGRHHGRRRHRACPRTGCPRPPVLHSQSD
jgi:hypothetical protein